MTDATEAIAHVRRHCEMPYPDNYSGSYGFGTMRAILAHIDAQAAEIERLTAERDEKATKLANLQVAFHDWKVFHSTVRIEAENERLREWIASDIRRPGRIRAHRNR